MANSGKLTPEQIEELEQKEREIVESWRKIQHEPAIVDLLTTLTATHLTDYGVAVSEVENATKAVAALQSANAYAKIKAYITDKML